MRLTRSCLLVSVLALGACPRSAPTLPDNAGSRPELTVPVCAPPLVAAGDHDIRVPAAFAAILGPEDSLEGPEVSTYVLDGTAPGPTGIVLRWNAALISDRSGDWFPDDMVTAIATATGRTPTVARGTFGEGDPTATVTARWDEDGSTRTLEIDGQPLDPYPVYVRYVCERAGSGPLSWANVGEMVAELAADWLPTEVVSALANREIRHAATGTDWIPYFSVEIPTDDAWVERLRAALLAAGYAEGTRRVLGDVDAATFKSADRTLEIEIYRAPNTDRLLIDVRLDLEGGATEAGRASDRAGSGSARGSAASRRAPRRRRA